MTHRSASTRQSSGTNSVISSRQLNQRAGAAAAKTADIEKFSAAMRAKEDKTASAEGDPQNQSENSTDTFADQPLLPALATLTTTQLAQLAPTPPPAGQSESATQAEANSSTTRGMTNLALTLQKNGGSPVEQTVTIVQRIIDSTQGSRETKAWKLELIFDGEDSLTLQLEFLGQTDWSIGLLDDERGGGARMGGDIYDEQSFNDELRGALLRKNPQLRLSFSTYNNIA